MTFTTLVLTIDSVAVPSNQIRGSITVSRRENESSSMDVGLITPSGLQDIDAWAGKSITLDIDSVRIFTGTIDRPEINLVYKRIKLVCTDKRRETLNADFAATISTIGFYSPAIFNETENVIEELDQRLTTIPSAADILPSGVSVITDINPKAIADIVLNDADVYRRVPQVIPVNRAKLINKVNLSFSFRYNRLRHRERNFKIQYHDPCYTIINNVGSWKKETFLENARQMSWVLNETTIVYEDLPPSGNVLLSCGVDIYVYNWGGFASSMTYKAATRFAQTITEDFQITVQAPQSIAQYGTIEWNQSNGYRVEFDSKEWEKTEKYRAPTGGTADANDYFINKDGLVSDYDNAVLTAINIANTKIVKSHRDTLVNFETEFRSDFDLTKTISLSTATVSAVGKITSINHVIDTSSKHAETTTEIALSTAQGAQVADSLIPPARPLVPVVADAFPDPQIFLFTDGIMETPPIDDTSRNEQIVQKIDNYDIEIKNSTFSVTF